MRWSIRAKLTAIVLAVLVPLVVGALFKFWQEQRDSRERAQERMLLAAQSAARQLDELLSGQIENLEVLVAARALDRFGDADLTALTGRIRSLHPVVRGFLFVAPDGAVLAASQPRQGTPAAPETLRAVQEAARSGEPQVSAPGPSLIDGRLVIAVVMAVADAGRTVRGAIVEELDVAGFSVFLDAQPAARAGLTVATLDGRLVGRSSEAAGQAASFAGDPQLAQVRQGGGAARWRATSGGERYLLGAAPLARGPWAVLASISDESVAARAAGRLRTNLLGLAAATALGVLVAWLIGRQMSGAVATLIAGARGLRSGRTGPIAVAGTDELAELAGEFTRAMEGRRAVEDELDVRERRLQALAEVNLALSQELDPARLFQQITDALARLTRAPVVVLWEAHVAERRLIRRAWTADASISSVDLPAALGFDEGVAGWVATHRQAAVIEDITVDPRVRAGSWAARHDLLSLASIPVDTGEDLAGVLTLNLKRKHKLSAEERALLGSFASQAAIAVRNARLFAETQARREVAEAVAGVGRVLAQALDPGVVAPRFAESIRALLGARSTALYRVEASGEISVLARSGASGRADAEAAPLGGRALVSLAVRDRAPVTTANALTDERLGPGASAHGPLGTGPGQDTQLAMLAVPLVVKDVVVGALKISDVEGRVFTTEEVRVAETFADQAGLALENARLFAEATRRRREAEELARVARMFTESLDVVEVARRVVDGVLTVSSAVSSGLYLLEPDGSMRAIAWGGRARQHFDVDQIFPRGAGVMSRAADSGVASWCRDVLDEPGLVLPGDMRDRIVGSGNRAVLAVPLRVKGQITGVLSIADAAVRDFEPGEVTLLEAFADQAAVALEHARLFATVQRRRREAEELARVGRALAQTLDPDGVARQIVDSLQIVFGVRAAVLFRLAPGTEDLVTWVSAGPPGALFDAGFASPRGAGLAERAVRERRPVASASLLEDLPGRAGEVAASGIAPLAAAGVETGLAVPLLIHDRLIGALALGDVHGRVFDDSDVTLAQAFADEAALVLENARLFTEATDRRHVAEELARVARTLTESLDVADVGQRIVDSVLPLLHARFARLRLRQSDGSLLGVARAGLTDPEAISFPAGIGVSGQAVSHARAVRSSDVLADPGFALTDDVRRMVVRSGVRAIAGAPLRVRGEIIGSLTIGDEVGRQFTDDEMSVLQAFADQGALALDNARLYEEARARLRELQETQSQLVQAGKLSAVGQLVSGVAHELNNPLSVVIGHGQLLLARGVPPEMKRPLELILAQGDRMAKIVQGLLLFSRQRPPSRGPVDIGKVIDQILELRAAQLRLSGIAVEIEHAEGGAQTIGDAHQLQQVFLNLILNAEQAILAGGVGDALRVRTEIRREGDAAWIVVTTTDNGPGIPSDVLPHVFDPFFTTKPVGQGTGLGLSVSYGIVQQHGGRLTVESRPGHTQFTVELPVIADKPAALSGIPAAQPRAVGTGRQALVVEDEPALAELMTTLLRQTGWRVDVAPGGRVAIEQVRGTAYDLIVSDVRMPDGSGEELYRAATAERRELATRFVFVTGDTASPQSWRFLEGTHAPVLEKPFSADDLLNAVERLVAEPLSSSSPRAGA